MENGPKIKIFLKLYFLMDFWIIRDYLTIVIWQKYLLYVKWSRKWIFVDKTPFFGQTSDFEIALKRQFSKYLGMPEMALP